MPHESQKFLQQMSESSSSATPEPRKRPQGSLATNQVPFETVTHGSKSKKLRVQAPEAAAIQTETLPDPNREVSGGYPASHAAFDQTHHQYCGNPPKVQETNIQDRSLRELHAPPINAGDSGKFPGSTRMSLIDLLNKVPAEGSFLRHRFSDQKPNCIGASTSIRETYAGPHQGPRQKGTNCQYGADISSEPLPALRRHEITAERLEPGPETRFLPNNTQAFRDSYHIGVQRSDFKSDDIGDGTVLRRRMLPHSVAVDNAGSADRRQQFEELREVSCRSKLETQRIPGEPIFETCSRGPTLSKEDGGWHHAGSQPNRSCALERSSGLQIPQAVQPFRSAVATGRPRAREYRTAGSAKVAELRLPSISVVREDRSEVTAGDSDIDGQRNYFAARHSREQNLQPTGLGQSQVYSERNSERLQVLSPTRLERPLAQEYSSVVHHTDQQRGYSIAANMAYRHYGVQYPEPYGKGYQEIPNIYDGKHHPERSRAPSAAGYVSSVRPQHALHERSRIHELTAAQIRGDRPMADGFQAGPQMTEGVEVDKSLFLRGAIRGVASISHDSQALHEHTVNESGVSFGKPYGCGVCGKKFRTKQGFIRHNQTVHLKIRPYKCDQCGATFGQKCSLQRHQKAVHHEVDIRWKCEHAKCAWEFSEYRLLQAHIKSFHHGEPPYICAVPGCTASFMWKSSYENHLETMHTGHDRDLARGSLHAAEDQPLPSYHNHAHLTRLQHSDSHHVVSRGNILKKQYP